MTIIRTPGAIIGALGAVITLPEVIASRLIAITRLPGATSDHLLTTSGKTEMTTFNRFIISKFTKICIKYFAAID